MKSPIEEKNLLLNKQTALTKREKDLFGYFGVDAKIKPPFRILNPHRIRVGSAFRCATAGLDSDVPLRPGAAPGVGSPDASRSAQPSRRIGRAGHARTRENTGG